MGTHPCEEAAARALLALRAARRPLRAESGKAVVPQVYLGWDTEASGVTVEVSATPGALLSLRATVTGAPRWFSLSLALGAGVFAPGAVLGLAVRAVADRDLVLAPMIRSRKAEATSDTRLAEPITLGPTPREILSLHEVRGDEALARGEQFHSLILPLPRESFALTLHGMRFFVADGAGLAGMGPATLGSFAA